MGKAETLLSETRADGNCCDGTETSVFVLRFFHCVFVFRAINMHPLKSTSANKGVFKIIVEGNIGSGKTTFLNIFSKNCSNQLHKPLIVPEPIDLWRDVGGENVFQLLGDNPKRWSFAFQSYVQLTMMKVCILFTL